MTKALDSEGQFQCILLTMYFLAHTHIYIYMCLLQLWEVGTFTRIDRARGVRNSSERAIVDMK